MNHSTRRRMPWWKKLGYGVVTAVAVLALVEAALWLCDVRPVGVREDPLVGFAQRLPLFVEQSEADEAERLETAPAKLGLFNHQQFPREKPTGTYRIFCVGGSTVFGRPYDDRTSFTAWLREILPRADDSRRWEVINAGGISYASYRVAAVMEELATYEPDLFVVYTGHNEFLEERSYRKLYHLPKPVLWLTSLVSETRTYSAAHRLLMERHRADSRYQLPGEVDARLDHSVGPADYQRDDLLRRQIVEHFAINLGRMVDMAHSAGADVLFVVPASNLKDCSPFKSEPSAGLSAEQSTAWQSAYQRGVACQRDDDLIGALDAFKQAATIDPHHAQALYHWGQSLLAAGRQDEALAAFHMARDEDVCPLRAISPLVDEVRAVAIQRKIELVDFEAIVQRETEHRVDHAIAGRELFFDHVHPTVEGHRLLATKLVEQMARSGIVEPSAGWETKSVAMAEAAIEQRIDPLFQALALRNVAQIYSWAGKLEEAGPLALKAVETLPRDRQALFIAGAYLNKIGRFDEANAYYRRALEEEVAADPDDVQARRFLAEALRKARDVQAARQQYAEILRLRPGDAEARRAMDELPAE